MARVIGLMGESGSGKTTSLRNLDPKTTFIIDSDKKGLSWKGWRNQYSVDKKNYYPTDLPEMALNILQKINTQDNMKHIKVAVVDTMNGIMVSDEVRRMKEKNYDKWVDLAQCIWKIVDEALTMRDDLTVIFVFHSQTQKEDDGYTFTRIKTSGKKLDKLCVESKLTTVLWCVHSGNKYKYILNADNSTCKVPMGAIEDAETENDIVPILKALEDF